MEILKGLNKEQTKAVSHGAGPLLIVAGAGTGKTTVIARRLAWLIDSKKVKPDEILALTFTDKSAGELEERIDKLLPYGYTDLWVSTFHSFGERLLERHALDIGVPHDFKLFTETEQWLLVRRNIDRFNLNYYRPLGNPTRFIHALVHHFSRAKDEEIYPEDYLKYAEKLRLNKDTERTPKAKRRQTIEDEDEVARIEEIANAYHTYQQLLLENNALDFGDLINYTLKLFRTRPEILKQYRQKFKYFLVDEFQDTNWSQYELVKLLAIPENNLTVVGDDDQSIYRFRGASMSNILQFKKDYPGSANVVLVDNYRSTQNILDLAYSFIQQNNPNRLEYQLNSKKKDEKLSKKLKADTKVKGVIEHLHGSTLDDEQALVVNKILELKKINKKISWGNFAILARSNEQANQFDLALARSGVPHQSYASRGLYKKPVVVDAISYLRMLDNYHDSPSLWRVLSFSLWKLSGEDLVALSHYAKRKSISLYEALRQIRNITQISSSGFKIADQVLAFIKEHTLFAHNHRPTELLVKVLTDIGYTSAIEAGDPERAKAEFNYLNQLYDRLKRWEETEADPRLKDFMSAITYEIESGETGVLDFDPDTGPDVVKVMTVHAAKGLEFKYVFIVGLVDRRFPTVERRDPIEIPEGLVKEILPSGGIHLEEERRLFYVAMTRAQRGLFLTSAEDYGGVRKKKLSRFLTELNISLATDPVINNKSVFTSYAQDRSGLVEVFPEPIPNYFSFTALKAFDTCPLQYRYSHILRVPVWGRHTFSFGQSMHLALERFFQLVIDRRNNLQANLFEASSQVEIAIPTKKELLELYEEAWIDEWYPSRHDRDRYFALGRDILKTFYDQHKKHWPLTQSVEKGFTLKLGPYSLRGKIDRIDKTEKGIAIIDYKTGSVPQRASDLDRDQLLIYQMAAEVVWGEKPTRLTFYYLNENKPISFIGTEEDLKKMEKKIITILDKIQESKFLADPDKVKCGHCDFKDICPFSVA